MSLFENEEYQWRETYFILFPETQHPLAADVRQLLEQLGDRFQISDIRQTPAGELESLTVISPQDFAGMDIAYNAGEDVVAQVEEVVKEMARATLTREDREKLKRLKEYTARFEIFHFERVAGLGADEDEGFLDPGGLLIVLQHLADHYNGVSIDPQSGAFL